MNGGKGFEASAAYRLDVVIVAESPVLLPLPGHDGELPSLVRFCRRVCPGAPLLMVDFALLRAPPMRESSAPLSLVVDRLATVISAAVQAHELALIPIMAVGNSEGADLAACLGLAHGHLLGACILLQPTTVPLLVRPGTLDGVHILPVRRVTDDAHSTVDRQLSNILKEAGAEVICEQTSDIESLGPQETAIAHVFAATLFGA